MRACQPKVKRVRPLLPHSNSFSYETIKDTAGCRAFHRNYIVGGHSTGVEGTYVDTVGKNASRIAEYIKKQLQEDQMGEQLTMSQSGPFTGK